MWYANQGDGTYAVATRINPTASGGHFLTTVIGKPEYKRCSQNTTKKSKKKLVDTTFGFVAKVCLQRTH